jgi:hypothetical protein
MSKTTRVMTPKRNLNIPGSQQERQRPTPLLVSDFCQRSKHVQSLSLKRNRRKNQECDNNNNVLMNSTYGCDSCKCAQSDLNCNEIQINVNILRSLPFLQSQPSSFQNEKNSSSHFIDINTSITSYNTLDSNRCCSNELIQIDDKDTFATVYTRDVELLHELQIFNGQICFLWNKCQLGVPKVTTATNTNTNTNTNIHTNIHTSHNHHTCTHCNQQRNYNYHYSKTPIILKVLPMDYQLDVIIKDDDDAYDSNNYNKDVNPKKQYQIYIPPTIAGSIGLHVTTLTTSTLQSSTLYISPTILNCNDNNIPLATKANIIEIGKHPIDYIMTFDDLCNLTLKDNQQIRNDEAIKELFYNWKHNLDSMNDDNKSKNIGNNDGCRLVGIGTVFGTLPSTYNSYNDDNEMIRFYKVIDLECKNDKRESNSQHDLVCWLSPKTKLTLVHKKNEGDVYSMVDKYSGAISKINNTTFHRLPQSSLVKTFIKSVRLCHEGKINDLQVLLNDDAVISDSERLLLDDLSKEVLSISSDPSFNYYGSQRILASHMLHVIRSGEKELKQSLDYTADKRKF